METTRYKVTGHLWQDDGLEPYKRRTEEEIIEGTVNHVQSVFLKKYPGFRISTIIREV
jgi:hypothetical protein